MAPPAPGCARATSRTAACLSLSLPLPRHAQRQMRCDGGVCVDTGIFLWRYGETNKGALRRRPCVALRCAVATPPRRRRRRSDRPPSSSPSRMKMRVPARVAKMVAVSDGAAIAIAMFPRDHLPDVAVSLCVVVASCVWFSRLSLLSRRDNRRIFSSLHEISWRDGAGPKAPRASGRLTDRPLSHCPPFHARVALEWRSAESTTGAAVAVCDTHISHRGSRALARARGALYLSPGRRPVVARGYRARTGAHATLSSCRLTEAKSIIIIVTW